MRISVADITRDGPFSAFAGIDRWFAVLTGEGVRLGDPATEVTADDDALRFDGGDAPACALRGGPTRDLNLMLRADRVRGEMVRVDGERAWREEPAVLRAVFTRDGCALVVGDLDVSLPPMTRRPSFITPRSTTSNTWPRTPTAIVGSVAPASRARSA